jgi:small-conductance mechanosensitive channel
MPTSAIRLCSLLQLPIAERVLAEADSSCRLYRTPGSHSNIDHNNRTVPPPWFPCRLTKYFAVLLVALFVLAGLTAVPSWAEGEPELATTIEAVSSPSLDRQIERRLSNIYSNLEGLSAIRVEVNEGIVTLSGEIQEREAEQRALELAARTAEVVSVQNRLVYSRDVEKKLSAVFSKLQKQGLTLLQYLPVLLVAGLIFLAFWLLGKWATSRRAFFDRVTPNVFIGDLVRHLVRIAITLCGLIIALEVADATSILGSVLGALGVAGLALGFAIRDTVENYIASILLSLRQPFSPNDHVIIEGQEGLVLRLTSRATLLMSFDGNHIRIPNSAIYKGVIINYSRNPRRRFSFSLGVGTDVNLIEAMKLAETTLAGAPGVLASPAPLGQIDSLGDSNVILKFFAWVDQEKSNYSSVRSEAIRRLKAAYERADFDMPEPIFRLQLQDRGSDKLMADQVSSQASLSSAGISSADREPVENDVSKLESQESAALAQAQAAEEEVDGGVNLLNKSAPKE